MLDIEVDCNILKQLYKCFHFFLPIFQRQNRGEGGVISGGGFFL